EAGCHPVRPFLCPPRSNASGWTCRSSPPTAATSWCGLPNLQSHVTIQCRRRPAILGTQPLQMRKRPLAKHSELSVNTGLTRSTMAIQAIPGNRHGRTANHAGASWCDLEESPFLALRRVEARRRVVSLWLSPGVSAASGLMRRPLAPFKGRRGVERFGHRLAGVIQTGKNFDFLLGGLKNLVAASEQPD